LLLTEDRLDDAQVYLERLKSHVVNDPYALGLVIMTQAGIWCERGRFEEARSEVLRIISGYEKIAVSAGFLEYCKEFLREVEEKMNS
jgi:hypothetical protein